MVTASASYLVTFVLTIVVLCRNIQGEDFFCQNNQVIKIQNTPEGRIITRESGTNYYANKLHCTWIIEANASVLEAAINIKVLQSKLQWAPAGAICTGYDYITVYNGSTTSAAKLLTWCGESNPYSLTSSGPALYIEFFTNDRNQYQHTGVELQFKIFERKLTDGGCPPDWMDDATLPGGGNSCYKLSTHKETWVMAQTYCSYDQSNLISITSEKEDSFISELVSSNLNQLDKVWLSLNDIEVDGQYKWLNGDEVTFDRWRTPNHRSDAYYNCIAMDKDGLWHEDFCNENDIHSVVKHKFICKKNKVGSTPVYHIPAERQIKGGEHTVRSKTVVTIVVSLACVVVAIILAAVLIYCCRKAQTNKEPASSNQAPKYEVASSEPLPRQQLDTSKHNSSHERRQPPINPTAPPLHNEPPQTLVVVVQQPSQPSEPPPPYEESGL